MLLAVSERDGELEQAVESTATATVARCASCGAVARPHARRPVWVRDLPAGGRPVTLVWVKRVWRCHTRGVRCGTWTETRAGGWVKTGTAWRRSRRRSGCRGRR